MKKFISTLLLCAILVGTVGCTGSSETSGSSSDTSDVQMSTSEQKDTSTTVVIGSSSEAPVEDTNSEEIAPDDKPNVKPAPAVVDNEFNIDGLYNTTIENNLDDGVYFEVYIEYTKDDGEVVSETITLNDKTSYDDIANKLTSFGIETTNVTRDIYYGEDYEWSDYAFEYKGIGHNISLAPDTETALYLELVDDKGVVTDASLLSNSSYNPSVKAMSSKLFTDWAGTDGDGNLYQNIPVTVIFKIYVSDEILLEYEDWQKEKLNEEGAFEVKVGMSTARVHDMFATENIGMCYVMKNTKYTFVVYVDDTFSQYIGDVILIKN